MLAEREFHVLIETRKLRPNRMRLRAGRAQNCGDGEEGLENVCALAELRACENAVHRGCAVGIVVMSVCGALA
jgi:hypothetical protein